MKIPLQFIYGSSEVKEVEGCMTSNIAVSFSAGNLMASPLLLHSLEVIAFTAWPPTPLGSYTQEHVTTIVVF